MSSEAQLEALLEIINASARQAIAEYKRSGDDVPTIHSRSFHPLDSAIDTVALKKAVRLLEGACQQLCASLAPPQHTFHNYAMSFNWACVRVVTRAKVADVLEKFPNGLHVDELATLVKLEKGNLARILRLLATKGCFTEVAPNTFANNRISLVALSSSNAGALSQVATEDIATSAAKLYEIMTTPEYATSSAPEKAPIIYVLRKMGFQGSYFDWVQQDPDRLGTYHRGMKGINAVTGSLSVLHQYPWKDVRTVCDVGASIGNVSIPLSKAHPHLKIINQDLPEVLEQAKNVWANDAPEALQNNQVEFVPLNFLEGGPVPEQDVYYLRSIIHDWPDSEAVVILKNVRNAMGVHSRLLIQEYVLVPASRNYDAKALGVNLAPEPLLPNFGHGNDRHYQLDLAMWIVHNSKERMLGDFTALGEAAGLRLDKVYDLAEFSVLEFRLA